MKALFLSILFLQLFTSNAQKLVSFKIPPCKDIIGVNFYRNRIVSKLQSNDTLKLRVSFVANCGIQYKGSLETGTDSLLLNFENVSDVFTTCDCLFFMDIVISEFTDTTKRIFINEEEFFLSDKKYIDLPPRTVNKKEIKNRVNDKGLKIGFWKIKSKFKPGFYYISFYGNGEQKNNHPLWIKAFDNKGNLMTVDLSLKFYDEETSYIIEPDAYEQMLKENENGTQK